MTSEPILNQVLEATERSFCSTTAGSAKVTCNKLGFLTADQAALAVLRIVNPKSKRENLEYGGLIYKDAKGYYHYTGPISAKNPKGVNPWDAPIPADATEVGNYHTHGDYSVGNPKTNEVTGRARTKAEDCFDSDNFSENDHKNDNKRCYLATPGGRIWVHDPEKKREDLLEH